MFFRKKSPNRKDFLTAIEIQDIARARIKYKPNFQVFASESHEYPGWVFLTIWIPAPHGDSRGIRPLEESDTLVGREYVQLTCFQELQDKIYSIISQAENHEKDEWFCVDGERIYDPHKVVT